MPSTRHDDGTRQLLQAGVWTIAAGVLAAALTSTVFGGIGRQGPHTNSGWICLMIALMCLPFGAMAFTLGAAKWLRNHHLSASGPAQSAPPLNQVSREAKSLLSFSEHSMEHSSHGKERQ